MFLLIILLFKLASLPFIILFHAIKLIFIIIRGIIRAISASREKKKEKKYEWNRRFYEDNVWREQQAYNHSGFSSNYTRDGAFGFFAGMTPDQAKARYKQLAKIYHPDNPRTGNADIMKEIEAEYRPYKHILHSAGSFA